MDRKFFPKLSQATCDLAKSINEEAKRDPSSPYAGKHVGIADGRVVMASENPDEVFDRLQQEPDPQTCCMFEASLDYDRIVDVWRVN